MRKDVICKRTDIESVRLRLRDANYINKKLTINIINYPKHISIEYNFYNTYHNIQERHFAVPICIIVVFVILLWHIKSM